MSATLTSQRERIARLNDLARRAMGVACTAVATVGFRSLPEADQSCVRELIETFDAFDEDNDPHGERDFGTIYQIADGRWTTDRPRLREDERERVFWKLDLYEKAFVKDLRGGPHFRRLTTQKTTVQSIRTRSRNRPFKPLAAFPFLHFR